jgi:hypothetical protein
VHFSTFIGISNNTAAPTQTKRGLYLTSFLDGCLCHELTGNSTKSSSITLALLLRLGTSVIPIEIKHSRHPTISTRVWLIRRRRWWYLRCTPWRLLDASRNRLFWWLLRRSRNRLRGLCRGLRRWRTNRGFCRRGYIRNVKLLCIRNNLRCLAKLNSKLSSEIVMSSNTRMKVGISSTTVPLIHIQDATRL